MGFPQILKWSKAAWNYVNYVSGSSKNINTGANATVLEGLGKTCTSAELFMLVLYFFFFQPFLDIKSEVQTEFLTPPTKNEAAAILRSAWQSMESSTCLPLEVEAVQKSTSLTEQSVKEESQTSVKTNLSSDNGCGDGNDLKRKSAVSFHQPPAKTLKMSELDLYLSRSPWKQGTSLQFWSTATNFPVLGNLARKVLAAPATCGGFDRLYPMSSCIIRAKRNRLPPHTTERLLLYRNSMKTKASKKPSEAAKN